MMVRDAAAFVERTDSDRADVERSGRQRSAPLIAVSVGGGVVRAERQFVRNCDGAANDSERAVSARVAGDGHECADGKHRAAAAERANGVGSGAIGVEREIQRADGVGTGILDVGAVPVVADALPVGFHRAGSLTQRDQRRPAAVEPHFAESRRSVVGRGAVASDGE